MRIAKGCLTVALLTILGGGLALGSQAIPNWPAPATWTPHVARGLTTLSVTNPLPFIGVTPCRAADTRGNGFTGAYGPPSIGAGGTRTMTLTGVCGVANGAAAVSLNITITNISALGDVRVFPAGGTAVVSTQNWTASTGTIANAAVVPLGTGGAVTFTIDGFGAVDLIVDVNGYYTQSSASASFEWDTAGSVGIVGNSIASTGESFGVIGQVGSSTGGSAGVSGLSTATTGATYGVLGTTGSISANAAGVFGIDGSGAPATSILISSGVLGESSVNAGVLGASGDFAGVAGVRFDTAANIYTIGYAGYGGAGVYGLVQQPLFTDEAGAFGVDATGLAGGTGKDSAGVRGESRTHFGVLGQGQVESVRGELLDTAGNPLVSGHLGFTPDGGTTKWGVYATGNVGASGTKPFVEVHPTDASKEIRYVALEGPEAGTYFRGRARLSHGSAVIPVPESFRLVSDEEGLTVQVTPIGEPVTIAVTEIGLDQIVVRAPKDVEFFYTVNGVRQAFKDWAVIAPSADYMPKSPADRMPEGFSPEQKRRLIANGTYNPDGTVNMQTAERVGWTRVWKEWEERDKAAVAAAQAKGAARNRRDMRATSGERN